MIASAVNTDAADSFRQAGKRSDREDDASLSALRLAGH